jgi:positive regulator of sigma E activity
MRGYAGGCAVKTDGREGTVIATEEEYATVLLEADAGCGQGVGCAHCSLFRPESHTVQVRRGDLQEGDRVRLLVSGSTVYRSIVMLFALPMALAVVGYFVGARIAGGNSDLGGVVGCVVGFVVAIAAALTVNRRLAGTGDLEVERIGRASAEG